MECSGGIKSRGDKIGKACTHSTVIYVRCPSPKESTTQALLSQRDMADRVLYIPVVEVLHMPLCVEVSVRFVQYYLTCTSSPFYTQELP